MLRCFYSSPYRSHPSYSVDPRAGVYDAMRRLVRLARPSFRLCLSVYDVKRSPVDCIWSPLLQGDVLRGEIEHYEPTGWPEPDALSWCLFNMKHMGFNTLVLGSTPKADGYGDNGCDAEMVEAHALGLRIMNETDLESYLAK